MSAFQIIQKTLRPEFLSAVPDWGARPTRAHLTVEPVPKHEPGDYTSHLERVDLIPIFWQNFNLRQLQFVLLNCLIVFNFYAWFVVLWFVFITGNKTEYNFSNKLYLDSINQLTKHKFFLMLIQVREDWWQKKVFIRSRITLQTKWKTQTFTELCCLALFSRATQVRIDRRPRLTALLLTFTPPGKRIDKILSWQMMSERVLSLKYSPIYGNECFLGNWTPK